MNRKAGLLDFTAVELSASGMNTLIEEAFIAMASVIVFMSFMASCGSGKLPEVFRKKR